jgi:DNA-binding PucR family transcriptional regulator
VSDELHRLVQRAYRTRRTRARIIVEDCLRRLPHYQGAPDSLLAEVRKSVVYHLGILYRVTLETGRPLTAEDLEPSRRTARKRAAQGVPLGEFLTFFLVGLTRAWEHLIACVGDDAALRGHLLDRVSAVISNQTQLMTAVTEAYVEERERLSRFRERDLDDFAQLLLAEDAVPNVLEARARALGVVLDAPRAVAILARTAPLAGEGRSVTAAEVMRWLRSRLPEADVQVGRSREGFVALLPEAPNRKVLAATAEGLLGEDARVGLGAPGRGIEGLRRSAQQALRALRIGASLAGAERVCAHQDVAVLDLVGVDNPRAGEFVRSVLGPLAAPGGRGTHLETLRQLAANAYHKKAAAAALSVHPHTLAYRVRQIERRLGFALDDPEVRLRVHLALLIHDALDPAHAAGPGRSRA